MNFILNNSIINSMRSNLFTTIVLVTVPSIVLSGIVFYKYIKDSKDLKDSKDSKDSKEDLQMENIKTIETDTKLVEVLSQQNYQLDGLMIQLETIENNLDNLRYKIERSSEVNHEELI
jgi:hypothetical protein